MNWNGIQLASQFSFLLMCGGAASWAQSQSAAGEFDAAAQVSQKRFVFNPAEHKWYAYGDTGELVADGKASGGKDYCPDIGARCRTPAGDYKVTMRRGANCKSSQFPVGKGGAPMPYCMFFHGGYAIHGSNDVPEDRNASHGCIRVETKDAKWLYENFIDVGTRVIVQEYAQKSASLPAQESTPKAGVL